MKLSGIDLNLLVALDALLSERNVTRAAERLSIGQSAMSAALGRLRRLFDDPLLVRQGSGLVPTPLADSLARPVHEALASIESIVSVRGSFDPEHDERGFTVLASDYTMLVLLRGLLRGLAAEAPGVRLHVASVQPGYLDYLRAGRADLLILPREFIGREASHFAHEPLFTDRFVCAVASDHPEVGEELTLEQLSSLPYLASHGGQLPALVEAQLDALGVVRRTEVTTENFVVGPFLLAGTRLVTMLYERLGRSIAEQAAIRLLDPPVALRPITECMYWSQRNTDDPGHRWLRERLRTLAHGLGETAAGELTERQG